MQVTCNACDKSINVPDEKVPKDQAFTLTCPSCKNKIRVDQHLKPSEPEPPPEPESDEINTFAFVSSEGFEEDDEVLEIYDENDKVALVLDHAHEDTWIETLSNLGYKLQSAKSPEHAVHKIKFTEFDLIVLHDEFGDVPLEENAAYRYLTEMPMAQRRKIFFILSGKNYKSTSNMEAYAFSVNVTINDKDFEKIPIILKKTINDNDNFYKIFKETLKALGKV